MANNSKSERFWYLILIVGLIFFFSGAVSGVKELLNLRSVNMPLSEYMVNPKKGGKLTLSECYLDYSVSKVYKRRSRRSAMKIARAKYHLLVPQNEVSNPKVYVFIDDLKSGDSKDFEESTTDSLGYKSFKGWKVRIKDPEIKKDIKAMLNTDADIVLLSRGVSPVSRSVYYPFIVAFSCFIILYIRGSIKNKLEKRRAVKDGQN